MTPYIKKNSQLCIERRIRGYYSAFVSHWAFVRWIDWTRCGHESMYHITSMVEWFKAARDIDSKGLPAKSISIVFQDDSDSAVFDQLNKAVRMRRNMLSSERRGAILRPPISSHSPSWFWPPPYHGTFRIGSPVSLRILQPGRPHTSATKERSALWARKRAMKLLPPNRLNNGRMSGAL